MAISFFTVEAIHWVCVTFYSGRAVFPLPCDSFFFPLYIDNYLSWLWVMKQLVLYLKLFIIWHSSYSVSLFFVSWRINIFGFGEITFLKKPQTITDYFLCTMEITISFLWRHSRFLKCNQYIFVYPVHIFVQAFRFFQIFEILRKLFLQFMAALKK